MNLLLDTHTLLWLAQGNAKLSAMATALLHDPLNRLNISLATVWEIAIKSGMGKLALAANYEQFMTTAVERFLLNVVPITLEDCVRYEALGFPNPSHRDPFDRMIVVHAQHHGLDLVSADAALDSYGIVRHW